MNDLSKRSFLKTGLLGAVSATGLFHVLTSASTAQEKPSMIINHLIDALRSTNKPVCQAVASKLSRLKDNNAKFDLHLRSAGLNHDEVKRIATAIKAVHDEGGPSLQSFSMSYNNNLRDEGVLSLVKSLPPTLTEIGLVGCEVGDAGGEALIAWANNAPKLHWLCVEQNLFSTNTKNNFRNLGAQRSGLLVVV